VHKSVARCKLNDATCFFVDVFFFIKNAINIVDQVVLYVGGDVWAKSGLFSIPP